MGPDPLDEALAELERGRSERLVLVTIVLVALTATVLLVVAAAGGASRPVASLVAAAALVAIVTIYVVSLLARERAAARATRALLAARAARAADEARVSSLAALHAAARAVSGSLELAEVVERAVEAATRSVGAGSSVLLLRAGRELAVAAASGEDPPRRGARRPPTDAERAVLVGGETVLAGRGSEWGDGPSTITAPLALPERVVGVLVVRAAPDARPFGEDDRLTVALLAEHVALALRNATALDRERQRAEAFRSLVGTQPDAPDGAVGRAERAPRGETSRGRDSGV